MVEIEPISTDDCQIEMGLVTRDGLLGGFRFLVNEKDLQRVKVEGDNFQAPAKVTFKTYLSAEKNYIRIISDGEEKVFPNDQRDISYGMFFPVELEPVRSTPKFVNRN